MENNSYMPTDMELVLYLTRLINRPSGTGLKIEREVFLEHAKKIIKRLSNPYAIKILEKEINRLEGS